jgi:hypothetical protein
MLPSHKKVKVPVEILLCVVPFHVISCICRFIGLLSVKHKYFNRLDIIMGFLSKNVKYYVLCVLK